MVTMKPIAKNSSSMITLKKIREYEKATKLA